MRPVEEQRHTGVAYACRGHAAKRDPGNPAASVGRHREYCFGCADEIAADGVGGIAVQDFPLRVDAVCGFDVSCGPMEIGRFKYVGLFMLRERREVWVNRQCLN